MLNARGDVSRIYLPPDANCLLSVADHCFRSRNYVNLIVIDKQPQPQWLTMDEAVAHCAAGAGIWDWAGTDDGDRDPDVVLACAGDVVTMEVVAAAQILKEKLPQLRVRVVNVVDLMTLPRARSHPHGMDDVRFGELFTDHVDVVFAFHGYHGAIHQLVHGRPDADRFHVRGFSEEGTTTTPFDMVVRNGVDRYHLVMDAINNAGRQVRGSSEVKAWCEDAARRAPRLHRRAPRGHARGARLGHDDRRRGLTARHDAGRPLPPTARRPSCGCVELEAQSRRGAMTTSMPLSRKACSATGSADSSVTSVHVRGMTAHAWKGDWPSLSAWART